MDSYFLDWANLLLRWVHVITAIAWIGSSFYFVFLDNNLIKPNSPDLLEKGVDGAMWAVHGGGFYHPVKFAGAPPNLPGHLHWFYWESYTTWMSGFALLTVSYLWNARAYLIDPARAAAFVELMQDSRRSRLRQGALGWELLHDMGQPGRYLEQIVDESWTEHLRRFDRITAADVALRDRKLAFHVAEGPPLVTRYAVEPALRADTAD